MSDAEPLAFLRVRELEWHDLVVPEDTLARLRELAAEAASGGLVAIVSGAEGVGKTVAVQTCAEQLRLDTWRVDCRALVLRHGPETAQALPGLLAVGSRPHAVLLFHHAEWLFENTAGGAGAALLDLAPGRLAPTVLETRDTAWVAPAGADGLTAVALPFPDAEARAELWRRLAWRAHPLLDLDVAALRGVPVPGAAIEAALERALEDCTDLPTTADVQRALARREHGRPPLP